MSAFARNREADRLMPPLQVESIDSVNLHHHQKKTFTVRMDSKAHSEE